MQGEFHFRANVLFTLAAVRLYRRGQQLLLLKRVTEAKLFVFRVYQTLDFCTLRG